MAVSILHNKNVTQCSLELNFMLNPGIEHVTFQLWVDGWYIA